MAHPVLDNRKAQRLVADVMEEYRKAFHRVQKAITHVGHLGNIGNYVFALDALSDDELMKLPAQVALAEEHRRKSRVAMQCVIELIALEQYPGVSAWTPPIKIDGELESSSLEDIDDVDTKGELDRFITILNFARKHGVMYINGIFTPVEDHVVTNEPSR